jgi:hypothetical protein
VAEGARLEKFIGNKICDQNSLPKPDKNAIDKAFALFYKSDLTNLPRVVAFGRNGPLTTISMPAAGRCLTGQPSGSR